MSTFSLLTDTINVKVYFINSFTAETDMILLNQIFSPINYNLLVFADSKRHKPGLPDGARILFKIHTGRVNATILIN